MATATLSRSEEPATPWWLLLIEGIALVILGILFLSKPSMTLVISIQILGLYWLIAGIVKIVSIFIDSSQWFWKLIVGGIGIIAGIMVIQHPIWSTAIVGNTLILVLGLMGIFMGIISIVQAFQGAGWGTGLLGVLSIIFGFVLIANRWWFTFSLPITLGILSIVGGIVALYWAFKVRDEQKDAGVVASEPELTPVAAAAVAAEEVEAPAKEAAAPKDEMQGQTPAAIEAIEEAAAKEEAAATDGMEASALHRKLSAIEGIGPAYQEKLNEAGVDTPGALLERCATPKGRKELAEQTGISSKLILKWTNNADLFRISGVASQHAELLEATGVDTVPELAQRNPQNLHEALVKANGEKKLVRHVPGESHVESWVAQAKELPRKIQY
jgi:uncharacterized membrane protein HdeD (DUF308 family)/predicted flap endonuclease-1-like 5' DNA nuclease